MKTLTEIANHYELDKGTLENPSWAKANPDNIVCGYTPIYEKYMDPVRNHIISLLEIGIWDHRFPGNSLRMWDEYFTSPHRNILGVDNFWEGVGPNTRGDNIREAQKVLQSYTVEVDYVDMSNRRNWTDYFCTEMSFGFGSSHRGLDFVIDDGSHWPSHIMIAFASVFPHVRSGGWYFIEDVQIEGRAGKNAYDNVQIGAAFLATSLLSWNPKDFPRLYITRKEHSYLINHMSQVRLHRCNENYLIAIQKT